MIKGLAGATIWSEDLNKLLPFYRDVLGLKLAVSDEEQARGRLAMRRAITARRICADGMLDAFA